MMPNTFSTTSLLMHRNGMAVALLAILALGCTERPTTPDSAIGHSEHDGMPRNEPITHSEDSALGHQSTEQGRVGPFRASDSTPLYMTTKPAEVRAGQSATLSFFVQRADGRVVRTFDTIDDERAHLILVREGLDEFSHLHPTVDITTGRLTASHTFPKGGRYFLFVEHKPKGESPALASAELHVVGKAAPAPALVPNAPGSINGDSLDANVTVAKPGHEAWIIFNVLDRTSGEVVTNLQPFHGALGHLVILSADGRRYVHAHAEADSAEKGRVIFGAHFSEAGVFKGWGEFRRDNRIRTIPFVIDVE